MIVGGLGRESTDLLRPAIVAGVRVDRDDFHTVGHGADASTMVLRPRKLPISTIWSPGRVDAAALYNRSTWSADIQPSTVGDARASASSSVASAHATYTPSPKTTSQISPRTCSMRSWAKISSGAAPWPCSRISV